MAKKLTPHIKAVQDNEVVFATLIHDEEMKIVAGGGVVLLKSMESGKPYPVPMGLSLPYQTFGQTCTVTVRDMTGEVILERGDNDIYEEELSKKKNQNVMPVDEWDDILTLMDELKLHSITKALTSLVSIIGGIALVGVSTWLLTTEFFLPLMCYICVVAGIGVAGFSIYGFIKNFRCADSKIIQDKNGMYINLDTGMTNLNGGMKIPIKQN